MTKKSGEANLEEVKPAPTAAKATYVRQSIADTADNCCRRILDAESLQELSESFPTLIENSIHRLKLDVLKTTFELSELRNSELRIELSELRLLHILSSYTIGGHLATVKKDIISLRLYLYDLRQLNAQTLID